MLGRGGCRRGRGLCGRRLFGKALREGMWEVEGRTLRRPGIVALDILAFGVLCCFSRVVGRG